MGAWSTPCAEEHAYRLRVGHNHRVHLEEQPGLALLHWSYSGMR